MGSSDGIVAMRHHPAMGPPAPAVSSRLLRSLRALDLSVPEHRRGCVEPGVRVAREPLELAMRERSRSARTPSSATGLRELERSEWREQIAVERPEILVRARDPARLLFCGHAATPGEPAFVAAGNQCAEGRGEQQHDDDDKEKERPAYCSAHLATPYDQSLSIPAGDSSWRATARALGAALPIEAVRPFEGWYGDASCSSETDTRSYSIARRRERAMQEQSLRARCRLCFLFAAHNRGESV